MVGVTGRTNHPFLDLSLDELDQPGRSEPTPLHDGQQCRVERAGPQGTGHESGRRDRVLERIPAGRNPRRDCGRPVVLQEF